MDQRDTISCIIRWLLPRRAAGLRRVARVWRETVDTVYPRGLIGYLKAIHDANFERELLKWFCMQNICCVYYMTARGVVVYNFTKTGNIWSIKRSTDLRGANGLTNRYHICNGSSCRVDITIGFRRGEEIVHPQSGEYEWLNLRERGGASPAERFGRWELQNE